MDDEKPTYRNAAEYTTRYRVTASDYLTVTGQATVKISKADQEAPAGLVGNNWTVQQQGRLHLGRDQGDGISSRVERELSEDNV
ncbi:MAG: hypothetical protein ACLU0O_12135 [Collinsella sp.]